MKQKEKTTPFLYSPYGELLTIPIELCLRGLWLLNQSTFALLICSFLLQYVTTRMIVDNLVPFRRCILSQNSSVLSARFPRMNLQWLFIYIYIFIIWKTYSGFGYIHLKIIKSYSNSFVSECTTAFLMWMSYCCATKQVTSSELKTKSICHCLWI